jgi:hypothetical protein
LGKYYRRLEVIAILGFGKSKDKKRKTEQKKDGQEWPEIKGGAEEETGGQEIPDEIPGCEAVIRNSFSDSSQC